MSLPGSSNGHRKPRADLYTVMLLVAFLALIVGTILLYAETADYGSPPWQGSLSPAAERQVAAASVEQTRFELR